MVFNDCLMKEGQMIMMKNDLDVLQSWDLTQKVDEAIHQNRSYTTVDLYEKFSQVSRCVVYHIITDKLYYKKNGSEMGAKNVVRRT